MKSYWLRLSLLGLLVFLVILVTNLPASLAGNWIHKHTSQDLNWQSLSGTIFDARAHGVEVKTESGRIFYIDQVHMQTSILYLFTGRIVSDVSIRFGDSVINGDLTLGIRRWVLDSINVDMDLNDLSSVVPELGLLGVRGSLELSGSDLQGMYHSLPGRGDADASINGLQLAIVNSSQPLGSYSLSIDTIDQTGIKGKIETTSPESQLIINGDIGMSSLDNTIQLKGQGWAVKDAEQAVRELLPLLGRVENGRAQINWGIRL